MVYFVVAFLIANGNNSEEVEYLRDFLKEHMELRSHLTGNESLTKYNSQYRFLDHIGIQHLDYLLGKSIRFEDKLSIFAVKLINGLTEEIQSYLTMDNLLLFAYYRDPAEKFFLSPLEIQCYKKRTGLTMDELLALVQSCSTVTVEKTQKDGMEAGFLYWQLGMFQKAAETLTPDLAFLALNEALESCD